MQINRFTKIVIFVTSLGFTFLSCIALFDFLLLFGFTVICIIIRYLLKPFIYAKLQMNNYYGEIITEYLTNYMCFIVLSVEIFSILFTFGVVKSVVVLLFVDTAIFIGLLVVGLVKMDLRGKEVL